MTVQKMERDRALEIPEILDLLVVGGGPGGTAAACRGKELGLSVLVIDYDDLMKRIRDYSKDKLILPSFGGGDQMCFPKGGEVMEGLCFGPIDKDDLCATFRNQYQAHDIPALTGVELLGLDDDGEGLFAARTWDHREQKERIFRARHVALAIGRGVPRRFDVPGNTDGIALRMEDPSLFTKGPACVVGGGTSAAEAVIALSHAKVAAGDPSEVHWSYRGDKMPRVSRALAEVFFEAYVGNGNIRYHPRSEPSAVVVAADREEYLAIRIDRRSIEGRPAETTHLEFPKESCIACIGEDLPTTLLESLGAPLVVGGPRAKKRVVVNRFLESRRPNLFLIGDLLSQVYLEASGDDGFEGDPAHFKEVKHRGNIKSALRDGVMVAQVVRCRMDGGDEAAACRIEDAEEPEGSGLPSSAVPSQSGAFSIVSRTPDSAVLIAVLAGGVQGEELTLAQTGVTTLGRKGCDLSFPDDDQLAERHASVSATEEGHFLRDDGSETGVFLRLRPASKRRLQAGDLLRAGRQFLLVAQEEGRYLLVHYGRTGQEVACYPLLGRTAVLGRQAPDITLDPDDRTLSRRHLALSVEDGDLYVKDLKSANGTELRVRSAIALADGDCFRVGKQILVLSTGAGPIPDLSPPPRASAPRPASPRSASPAAPVSASAPASPEASSGAPFVTLTTGESFAVTEGQTLCEAAEMAGVTLNAECHSGICGSDPVRILAGLENVANEPGRQEKETLEDLCELEPGPCRLACMMRLQGPVKVEIL